MSGCYDLYQNDELLADSIMERYSLNAANQRTLDTNPDSEFELYSDRYARKFTHYDVQ